MNKPGTLKRELSDLRHDLHRIPEASGKEHKTSEMILSFLDKYKPDDIIRNIGGHGIAAIYDGSDKGPAVLFRCELDGLPIQELNEVPYRSVHEGYGHMCGHDGHMSIVAGLSYFLSDERPGKGRVILLFQPSEENGKGAGLVIRDEKFSGIKPDYSFALHNLPQFPLNEVIIKYPVFAAASRGLSVVLKGKSSHAAEPEQGVNPAYATARVIQEIDLLMNKNSIFKDFTLITPIHLNVGSLAFGTSPGDGEMHFTLRSFRKDDMAILSERVLGIIKDICEDEDIKKEINFHEEFPVTNNDLDAIDMIKNAAIKEGLSLREIREPFKWSEDFGHFTELSQGAIFGLGSGENSPALHNPNYNFPDELLLPGVRIFKNIYENILNKT